MNEIGCNSQVFITIILTNPRISVLFHIYFLHWDWGLAEVQLIWLSRSPGFTLGLIYSVYLILGTRLKKQWLDDSWASHDREHECQVTKPGHAWIFKAFCLNHIC